MENVSKIKKISAADQVYTQLKTFILEGHWVPGEKIATETELAKSLGVNTGCTAATCCPGPTGHPGR